MTHVPVPQPPSPREEVIEILARGLCELVMRGCKPDQPREQRHPVFGVQARPIATRSGIDDLRGQRLPKVTRLQMEDFILSVRCNHLQ